MNTPVGFVLGAPGGAEQQPTELDSFYAGGPQTWQQAFPPICLRSHWDPTSVSQYILPPVGLKNQQQLDPRQAVKICTTYYTMSAGDAPLAGATLAEAAQHVQAPAALRGGPQRPQSGGAPFYPVGGAAGLGFPYSDFRSDAESDLLRLSEPLTKCGERRYLPVGGVPAPSVSTNIVPGADQKFRASATEVKTIAGCREADDAEAWKRSARMFFNPTRYDRTTGLPPNLRMAEARYALAACQH